MGASLRGSSIGPLSGSSLFSVTAIRAKHGQCGGCAAGTDGGAGWASPPRTPSRLRHRQDSRARSPVCCAPRMSATVRTEDVDRFYRAAVGGLAVLEARGASARRFGPDADARWNAFRGGLQDWHRIDLLVRDAAVRNPAGFAPRVVFDLLGLADDEPCGPEWPGPTPLEAATLLRAAVPSSPRLDLGAALVQAAAAWAINPERSVPAATEGIQPATRLLVAGASAVLALATAFEGRPELDLADQAVLLADDPGTRQLFGLALAFLDTRRPPRLVRTTATADDLQALGFTSADRLVIGDDVPPDARARIATLATALGVRL